jgi:uncharacterized membrane protein
MKRDEQRVRTVILTALFIALSVVLGYLLAGVPNIELMTLSVFLGGVFLGTTAGGIVGAVSILFYSVFNPYGAAPPPLIAAQLAAYILIGAAGGMFGSLVRRADTIAIVASAAAGLILTLMYDFLTTVATAAIALGAENMRDGFIRVLFAGSVFVAVHVLSNTALFAVAVVPIMKIVAIWENRGGR